MKLFNATILAGLTLVVATVNAAAPDALCETLRSKNGCINVEAATCQWCVCELDYNECNLPRKFRATNEQLYGKCVAADTSCEN